MTGDLFHVRAIDDEFIFRDPAVILFRINNLHLKCGFRPDCQGISKPFKSFQKRRAKPALFDQPEATLADVLRLLDDRAFRQLAAGRVANAQVRDFWLRESESYPRNFRAEAIAPIQNKVGAFLANPVLHGIVTQPRSAFDLRQVMDKGKILLVNLAKGKIGEDAAKLARRNGGFTDRTRGASPRGHA